jgi:ABC-2 type transport system ATP-binding protein
LSNALEVVGLRKEYREFALRDVSLELPTGYIMGFVGPNGSGKTTTIKAILGLIRPDGGAVRVFGEDPVKPGAQENQRVGVVMDTPLYPGDWTVRDVGRAVALFYRGWDPTRFAAELDRFDLSPAKRVRELSRGMKVKLQMAVALSHHAELLVLDEPTSGLDPVARDELCDLLREFVLDEDHSVLFSTHITQDLEKTADYITVLIDGRVAFTGELDGLVGAYVRVSGAVDGLDAAGRAEVIGYRERGGVFEGLARDTAFGGLPSGLQSGLPSDLPPGLLAEPATLDEIVVHLANSKEPVHV